jgi:L-fuculose-phosphate aldolase
MVIQGVSYPSDFEAKKAMIEIGRRMDEKGCVIAGDGSLSVRVGPNAVWITTEGAEKGALKQENFIRVDMNGKQSPGVSRQTRLPEDLPMHLKVYEQNPSLRGMIHGYPVEAAALALMGREVAPADYTPSVRKLGRMSLVNAGNADDLARAAAGVCKTDSGLLIAGDGCLVWGESITEAFHKLETLEYYAKVSRLMGGGHTVPGSIQASYSVSPSCGAQQAYTSPVPSAAVSDMVSVPAGEIQGLTPLIRPGETQGFCLPDGNSSTPAESGTGAVTATVRRNQTMAEVVRRSLASMQ